MKIIFFFFVFILFSSCNFSDKKLNPNDSAMADSMKKALQDSDTLSNNDSESEDDGDYLDVVDTITCDDLYNNNVLFALAKSIEENAFNGFDTTNKLVERGHFISKDSISILVRLDAYVGGACGDGCNMLMLFSCDEKVKMRWWGYTGVFSKNDITDLNDDGIPEIYSSNGSAWMGECDNRSEIFNFKGGKKNVLYESYGYSYVDCGFGDENDHFKKGDTVGIEIEDTLIDPDQNKIFEIKQFRTFKVYNGGKKVKDILDKEIESSDSIIIPLAK